MAAGGDDLTYTIPAEVKLALTSATEIGMVGKNISATLVFNKNIAISDLGSITCTSTGAATNLSNKAIDAITAGDITDGTKLGIEITGESFLESGIMFLQYL